MHKIKIRWVILDKNKIFLVREIKKHFYYLPWWTLEKWESFKECLKREIFEELWVIPIVWDLLHIREFKTEDWVYLLDIWFEIKNIEDFKIINKEKATHAFEYYDEWFYSFEELKDKDVKPWNIEEVINNKLNIDII